MIPQEATRLFHETMKFYTKMTGYDFPRKPQLKLFFSRKEFEVYLNSQKSRLPSLPAKECAGMTTLIFSDGSTILAVDLSNEGASFTRYPDFMVPCDFFHEYEHIRRSVSKTHITFRVGKAATKEEAEAWLTAFKLAEQFFDMNIPDAIHEYVKRRLLKEL